MTPLYLKLRSTLEDLAAPSAVQERKLKALGVGPDELALDFDAFGQAAANLVEQGELSAEAHALVLELLEMFYRFSGSQNAGEWTEAALHSSANWKKVRATASKALTLMQR